MASAPEDDPVLRPDDVDDTDDIENEPIDPRVECLLDQLNTATSQINRIEGEHFSARKQYRLAVGGANSSLEKLYRQSKKAIEKSRPYFEARKNVDQARTKSASAARQYEDACMHYEQAREALSAAEQAVMSGGSADQIDLDALNHAIELVEESRNEVTRFQKEYILSNKALAEAEILQAQLEKQHKKAIQQSELYYSTRTCIEAHLQVLANNVQTLADKVAKAKYNYRDAFSGLETVSDEIHDRRKSQRRLTRRDSGFIEELDTS